jgi:hypothetical protein
MTTPPTPDAIVLKGVTYVKQDGRWVAPMPGFISTATFVDAQEALDHIATLTAQLAAAKADGDRLDWLQSEHDRFDPVANITMKFDYDREYNVWANIAGDIRKEIDAARTGAR